MSAAIRPTIVPSPWGRLRTVICIVLCTVLCGMFRTALCAVPWVGFAAACLGPSAATAGETVPAPVREIGSRRELFVDEWLIDRLRNVTLRMHRPQPREVAIVCDAPWEGNTSAYFTLFADGDRFRMYYRGAHFDERTKQPTHPEFTCLAESRDGIRWEKPRLGLFEFAGSKENNIVWAGAETHNFTPFNDTNPACPADARYKALGGGHVRWGGKGLRAYTSPDGIRWSLLREEAIITDGDFDSRNLAFWDPLRQCYVAFFRKRFTFRTDGFVSASAGAEGGELVTLPLRFTGRELEINYRTAPTGSVRVELQSDDGTPLPGFTAADCRVIAGDEVSRIVAWVNGGDVGPLAGRPVRLRFVLDDADLFALWFR